MISTGGSLPGSCLLLPFFCCMTVNRSISVFACLVIRCIFQQIRGIRPLSRGSSEHGTIPEQEEDMLKKLFLISMKEPGRPAEHVPTGNEQ